MEVTLTKPYWFILELLYADGQTDRQEDAFLQRLVQVAPEHEPESPPPPRVHDNRYPQSTVLHDVGGFVLPLRWGLLVVNKRTRSEMKNRPLTASFLTVELSPFTYISSGKWSSYLLHVVHSKRTNDITCGVFKLGAGR